MLAIVLLAQVASATPVPTRAVALGSAPTAVSGRAKTLAELARERKLGKKGVTGGTLSVSGKSGMPVVPAGPDAGAGRPGVAEGNARLRAAETEVQAARRAVDDAAVKKGMTSEDTAAARRKLEDAHRELNQARESATQPDR